MQLERRQVVVITGGTASVGRAVAREFASAASTLPCWHVKPYGWQEETRRGLTAMRCKATGDRGPDVADVVQVEAAAAQVEEELGPIDVWVNNAIVTMVAPLADMQACEFQRACGTMAALKRMRARDRDTFVQVGSALAYCSIPLQSAVPAAARGRFDAVARARSASL